MAIDHQIVDFFVYLREEKDLLVLAVTGIYIK